MFLCCKMRGMLRIFLALLLCSAAWGQGTGNDAKGEVPTPATADIKSSAAPSDPLASARALLKDGHYEDAATAFRAIVIKDDTVADAQVGLMRSLLRARQVDDAESAGQKAVAVLPNSPAVHAAFGDVEFRAGKLGEAEAEYRSAMKLDGNSARAWFGIGRIYDAVFLRKRAKDAFAKAHELDASDEQIFERWLDTLSFTDQLEAFKKHVGEHPTEREAAHLKFLNELAKRKPFLLASEAGRAEIKIEKSGRKIVSVGNAASQMGGRTVGKGFAVHVKFNGGAGADLLLDTGADGILIGRKLAERAGVVKIADSYFGGIGDKGPVQGYIGWVDKINIGSIEFHNCIVEVSSRNDIIDESGLLGPGIFRQFLITFDWREGKMILLPLPKNPAFSGSEDDPQDRYIATEMQGFTKAYQFGDDHLFIPVVVSDKALGTFMLDTGADSNLVSPRLAQKITKVSYEGYVMRGVSGSVKQVLNGDKAILQFAKMRVRSDDIPVIDLEHQSRAFGSEVSGLIGIQTLVQMKMTIDYRDGLVDFQVYEFKKARD